MGKQFNATDTRTVLASGAVQAYLAVGFDGAQATVAGQKVLGFAATDAASGAALAVHTSGSCLAIAGDTITVGATLRVDDEGRVVPAAALAVANPTVNAGGTDVTSSAANGAILTQGAITGGYLPQFVVADALEAASEGDVLEVLLRR